MKRFWLYQHIFRREREITLPCFLSVNDVDFVQNHKQSQRGYNNEKCQKCKEGCVIVWKIKNNREVTIWGGLWKMTAKIIIYCFVKHFAFQAMASLYCFNG